MWWLWDHQGGGAPHIPEEVRWGTSGSWVPSLLQSVEVGLQHRPSLPAGMGLSPTIHNSKLAPPKKWVKGCSVFQSSSSWQQPGCQGLPELALAVSMATGGTPAPSVSENGVGFGLAALEPCPNWDPRGARPPQSPP